MIVAHELDVVSSEISEEAPTQAGDMVTGTIYQMITVFARNPGYTALRFCYFIEGCVRRHDKLLISSLLGNYLCLYLCFLEISDIFR